MGTFLSIQNRVKVAIIDLPTAVSDAVPGLVNTALKDIQDKANFWIMRATQTYTTVLNTRSLGATPANFKEFRARPYYLRNDGSMRPMVTAPDAGDILLAIGNADKSFPMVIQRSEPTNDAGASTMNVWPLPDGISDYVGGEYRIVVPYWKYMPALSADGDTNWLTVNAEEYIFKRAVAEGFGMDWDEERMALWLQRAENEFNTIVKADKKARLVGVDTLVPHHRGANSPLIRW